MKAGVRGDCSRTIARVCNSLEHERDSYVVLHAPNGVGDPPAERVRTPDPDPQLLNTEH